MVTAFRLAVLVAVAAIVGVGCSGDAEEVTPTTGQKVTITSTSLVFDPTSTTVSPDGAANPDAPSTTEVLDEFVVSTTANPADAKEIDELGAEIVDAWWYPDGSTTYSELADSLEEESLIGEGLANEWRSQGAQSVIPAPDETRIVKMWAVRVADDNATFQISAVADGDIEETLTFIEFELEDGQWKAIGIE